MDNKIVVDHDAGFFSNCTIRLKRIIDFYNKNKVYPIVDSSKQWNFYKDVDGDITEAFFRKNLEEGPFIEEHIDYFETNEDQFVEYYKLDFNNIKKLLDVYFSPSDKVNFVYDNLIKIYNINLEKTIGVCYRGNDKHKETNLPSHEEMLSKISEVKSKYPDHKILIQSDEVDFYQKVLSVYPDSIYFNEVFKIRTNPNSPVQYHIPIGQRVNQAVLFLAITFILSRCSKLVLNSGNVGMWVCFFRGNFDNVYQYLNHKEYVYGIYNVNYRKLENNWIENE